MDDDFVRAAYGGAATAVFAMLYASLPKLIYWAGYLFGRMARLFKQAATSAADHRGE